MPTQEVSEMSPEKFRETMHTVAAGYIPGFGSMPFESARTDTLRVGWLWHPDEDSARVVIANADSFDHGVYVRDATVTTDLSEGYENRETVVAFNAEHQPIVSTLTPTTAEKVRDALVNTVCVLRLTDKVYPDKLFGEPLQYHQTVK